MSTAAGAKVMMLRDSARIETRQRPDGTPGSALAEFEQIYRGNVDVVMAYFARRCAEPQIVADLTSETFVRAAGDVRQLRPAEGVGPGVAVRDRHPRVCLALRADGQGSRCGRPPGRAPAVGQSTRSRSLPARIDAERAGRELIGRCSQLPEIERAAVELVDLAGLTPKEAATALGVSRVVLRKRLSRARARLRKEHQGDE